MVNLSDLPRDKEAHLGWYLETTPKFLETYVCYAWEDEGDGAFAVKARAHSPANDPIERFDASRKLSLQIAKGKIFLGTWEQKAEYAAEPVTQRDVPTPLIRQLILRGLHRLYERGFKERDFQLDLDGIASELGVKRLLVDRAVDFLYQAGYVEDGGTFGLHRGTGALWLSHQGADFVESQGLTVETYLQELYRSTLSRLFALNAELAEAFDNLRERASTPSSARQEVIGFSSMVRDFVQGLTDHLHQRTEPAETLPREQTINKVKAITAAATSETSRDHVRALAEVVETHWRRLNDVQQKAVHEGTVETQRLFTYTLLFAADLLDVVEIR